MKRPLPIPHHQPLRPFHFVEECHLLNQSYNRSPATASGAQTNPASCDRSTIVAFRDDDVSTIASGEG
jgi:hypothetical protein